VADVDSVVLIPMTEAQVQCIAAGVTPQDDALTFVAGALPPTHVALRSLRQWSTGCPSHWALPFHIADASGQRVVGGCTFKGKPVRGAVEIGYGVAPDCRGHGYATKAIERLQDLATRSGEVREVFALISVDNFASKAVVSRAGFAQGSIVTDEDGERVERWHWRCAMGP
jgi:ribosomal-protein-alanine N-acetyltransferase